LTHALKENASNLCLQLCAGLFRTRKPGHQHRVYDFLAGLELASRPETDYGARVQSFSGQGFENGPSCPGFVFLSTRFRYVVPSVGKMDTVGKVAQSCPRPIRAVSLLRGVPF
jgi:hypothetical protein